MQAKLSELFSELLLTRDEVGRLLRVSPETIENLHRTGQLRAVKVGKHNRWKQADVRQWVEALGNGQES